MEVISIPNRKKHEKKTRRRAIADLPAVSNDPMKQINIARRRISGNLIRNRTGSL